MRALQDEKDLVISYLSLRRVIGIIGIVLPIMLFVGSVAIFDCDELQKSISDYYHTRMRNVFVGSLFAIGLFLFCYKGTGKENLFGNLGGIFAFGIILFPTDNWCEINCNSDVYVFEEILSSVPLYGDFHLISAFLFFVVLIVFSLVLFIEEEGLEKIRKKRNTVFRICGYTMIGCILAIAIYFIAFKDIQEDCVQLQKYNFVFWMETLALWAFGISWIVKGQLFWKDATEDIL